MDQECTLCVKQLGIPNPKVCFESCNESEIFHSRCFSNEDQITEQKLLKNIPSNECLEEADFCELLISFPHSFNRRMLIILEGSLSKYLPNHC